MITYSTLTDIGDRQNNEDSILAVTGEGYGCFSVADGLGGSERGEQASGFVNETIKAMLRTEPRNIRFVTSCMTECQNRLMKAKAEGTIGNSLTTLVLLLVTDTFAQWGHVGDSRLYLFRDGRIVNRTYDHSVPQILVRANEIQECDIRSHPDRNKLLRAYGQEWYRNMVELGDSVRTQYGDAFLLCSDGFWEFIEEWQMEQALQQASDVRGWLASMQQTVEAQGKEKRMDNYSAITVWIR